MNLKKALTVGVPSAVAAVCGAIGAQVWWVGNRPLPSFRDINPAGTFGDPRDPELRIGVIGDSTVTGPGLENRDEIWIRRIARRIAADEGLCVRLYTRAAGGSKARDVLANQVDAICALDPDLVIVSVGSNDSFRGTPLRRIEAEIHEICTRLDTRVGAGGGVVAVIGLGEFRSIPRIPEPLRTFAARRGIAADRVLQRVADEFDSVEHIPLRELAGDAFSADKSVLFAPDLFHISAAGHKIVADSAYGEVRELVTGASKSAVQTAN